MENNNHSDDRVLLAYFGGDNNLSSDAEDKMEAMLKGWSSSINGRLFVFYDSASDVPALFEIGYDEKNNPVWKTVYQYNEDVDSSNPEIFSEIIKFVTANYRADSYGLIVFSHASGWLPEGMLSNPADTNLRTIIVDKEKEMKFLDFVSVIPENVFDFIIFEACYMAGIEICYELRDKTGYIIASSSEILSPGFCHTYESCLNYLFEKDTELIGFAKTSFDYYNNLPGSLRSSTISVVKTSGLDDLGEWIVANCSDIAVNEIDLNRIQKFNLSSYNLFLDFQDYYSRLINDQKQEELQSLLNRCVLYEAATPKFMENYGGFTINKHSGLTTYVQNENYPYLNQEYRKLSWYTDVVEKIHNTPADE